MTLFLIKYGDIYMLGEVLAGVSAIDKALDKASPTLKAAADVITSMHEEQVRSIAEKAKRSIAMYKVILSAGIRDSDIARYITKYLEGMYSIFTMLTLGFNPMAQNNEGISKIISGVATESLDNMLSEDKDVIVRSFENWMRTYDLIDTNVKPRIGRNAPSVSVETNVPSGNATLEWKYVKPLKNRNSIANFEAKCKIRFPKDLKDTIIKYNGGRPSLKYFDVGSEKDKEFKTLLSFNESDHESIYKSYPLDTDDKTIVPFASTASGDYLVIKNDAIYLWNHETDKTTFISDNFTLFLNKLHGDNNSKSTEASVYDKGYQKGLADGSKHTEDMIKESFKKEGTYGEVKFMDSVSKNNSTLYPTIVEMKASVGPFNTKVSIPIAVKCNADAIGTEEMRLLLEGFITGKAAKKLRKIKWRSGEISTLDFIFNLDKYAVNKKLYQKLGRNPWYIQLQERKAQSNMNFWTRIFSRFTYSNKTLSDDGNTYREAAREVASFVGKNELPPTASLITTKEDLVAATRLNIDHFTKNEGFVKRIMKDAFLLCFGFVDLSAETLTCFFMGYTNPFVVTFEELKKKNDNETKALAEAIKELSRKV